MRVLLVISCAFALAACGGDKEEKKPEPKKELAPEPEPEPEPAPPPPPEMTTHDLVKVEGYQIEAPTAWKLGQQGPADLLRVVPAKGFTAPLVISLQKKPKSLEAAAKDCKGKVIDQAKVEETGAYYYVCEQTQSGRMLRALNFFLPHDKKQVVACEGSSADIERELDACKTLAKADAE